MLFFNRGVAYLDHEKVNEAMQDFDDAIELDPAFVEAYVMRGNLLGMVGEFDEAIADLKKALEVRPDHPHADAIRERIEHIEAMNFNF